MSDTAATVLLISAGFTCTMLILCLRRLMLLQSLLEHRTKPFSKWNEVES